jgi:hypothetical protein
LKFYPEWHGAVKMLAMARLGIQANQSLMAVR